MEDALVAMHQSLESANQQRDAAVDKMSQDERIEVRQMLNSLHVRLVNLQEHLDDRKRYTSAHKRLIFDVMCFINSHFTLLTFLRMSLTFRWVSSNFRQYLLHFYRCCKNSVWQLNSSVELDLVGGLSEAISASF